MTRFLFMTCIGAGYGLHPNTSMVWSTTIVKATFKSGKEERVSSH